MYVKKDLDFYELKKNSWSGAIPTLERIEELNKEDELMNYLEMIFDGETPDETELNDFLWFEDEMIFNDLGISWEDEEEKEEEEE